MERQKFGDASLTRISGSDKLCEMPWQIGDGGFVKPLSIIPSKGIAASVS
jgi:hypothetical protein